MKGDAEKLENDTGQWQLVLSDRILSPVAPRTALKHHFYFVINVRCYSSVVSSHLLLNQRKTSTVKLSYIRSGKLAHVILI